MKRKLKVDKWEYNTIEKRSQTINLQKHQESKKNERTGN
jgi:hypothetical protein